MKAGNTHKTEPTRPRGGACGTRSTRQEGGQPGNLNRQKGIVLPEPLNLESSEAILQFIKTVLIPSALAGSLGIRTVTAITSACKVLLDYESLQQIEARVSKLEEEKEMVKTN